MDGWMDERKEAMIAGRNGGKEEGCEEQKTLEKKWQRGK
jgi:hypothetical protein